MEVKSTLKDLIYLGVGAVAISAHKLEEYAHEIISKNETVREEGERRIEAIKNKASTVMDDLNQQKDELVKSVAEKTKVAEKEIADFFSDLMEKPNLAKEQLNKIDDMAHKIAAKTQLTYEEVKGRIEDFVNQVQEAQKNLKMRSEKVLEEVRDQAKNVKENTLELVDKIDDRTHDLREEMATKIKDALHRLRHSLDIASWEELGKLDERLKELEKK